MKDEGINVNSKVKTEYKDGKHVEIPGSRTFSVGNISGLNKEQFKKVLDIILEGKKTFEAGVVGAPLK